MFNKIKNFTFCAVLTLLSLGVVSCTEDDVTPPVVTEGVAFQFDMRTEYTVSNMKDIVTIDMTLIKDGKEIVLTNLKMEGSEASILSVPISLAEGTYTMKGYVAYGAVTTPVMECEFDLDDEASTFVVTAGQVMTVTIPVSVRVVEFENYIVNALIGLCREVFGDDESLWPWDKSEDLGKWSCLEFVYYDGSDVISHITGIRFDTNEFEGWSQMTEIPHGTISNLVTIDALIINNLPNLTTLPDDLHKLPDLGTVVIQNTALTELPKNFEKCKNLNTLLIDGADLTEFPAQVNEMKNITLLGIINTKIAEVTAPLTNLKLIRLDLNDNDITTFGEDVLSPEMGLSSINLSGNNLSTLPNSLGTIISLKAVNLYDNQFTVIPTQVKKLSGLMALRIGGAAFTTVTNDDLANFPKLDELGLNGSKNLKIGTLNHSEIDGLYLSNCGLTELPSIAGLPQMRLFEAENNEFTSISSFDFTANPILKKISLSDNAKLKSLPASTWGLSPLAPGVFSYLDLRNCPALNWTPNATWDAYDSLYEMYEVGAEPVHPSYIVPPVEEYENRVGIARHGSEGVVIK